MRRMIAFANRILKEILRDPLTVFFGLGFPLVVLLLLSLIQANTPVEMFEIRHLTIYAYARGNQPCARIIFRDSSI